MKINKETGVNIIEAYTVDLWSLREIAETIHVSPSAVHKYLRKHGVDTSKKRITVSCTVCGNPIQRTRKRIKKQRNHFCNTDCYTSYLKAGAGDYVQDRAAQRTARAIVSKYFDLQSTHLVHHKDRNPFNNKISNLMVFANQGDHIRHHHNIRHEYHNTVTNTHQETWNRYNQTTVTPLWDGENT
jgi:transcriptional regulator of acetoin/glycerol metabolism